MTAGTADAVPQMPAKPVLWNGNRIRHRWLQTRAWAAILGLFGVGLIAGLYFGISQVHWYIHIGSFYWAGFDLKAGWDAGMGVVHPHSWLINAGNWDDYRHAYRNIGLPAFAVMGALSITGGSRK